MVSDVNFIEGFMTMMVKGSGGHQQRPKYSSFPEWKGATNRSFYQTKLNAMNRLVLMT